MTIPAHIPTVDELAAAIAAAAPRAVESRLEDAGAVVDRDGNAHAPFDGWEWEGRVYRGGEFVAVEGGPRIAVKRRVRTETAEAARRLESALEGVEGVIVEAVEASPYGASVALTLTGRQAAAVDGLDMAERRLVPADAAEAAGIRLGKTWKYSWRRALSRARHCDDFPRGASAELQGVVVGFWYPAFR